MVGIVFVVVGIFSRGGSGLFVREGLRFFREGFKLFLEGVELFLKGLKFSIE